ncbi:MAG: tetratricopeptide repeat protein [Thermoanaerobaculales bacterium]|jgi:arylsulfatase A-like enzyme/Flp pilus assembly protein TadD|nr:tetratricopeptide repeat protein [Thermoanaerobaculales bacterium]
MVIAPFLLATAAATAVPSPPVATPPNLLLVTLDTTRADAVGAWGASDASTPVLDRLASLGVRFTTALAPAPLTLPSHATLLTGLDPPEHGIRSNGGERLDRRVPTIAAALADAGWATAAVVGSRVLDRRFGLDHGFASYDDRMPAERIGEHGYAERDARAVTDAALVWLADQPRGTPFLLWVHYYDPHAPYTPPAGFGGSGRRAAYLGEVSFVDAELGRLLRALPGGLEDTVVVVAGDHGEALGEHGEEGHGVFLYRSTLEVPLLLAGRGLPAGVVVDRPAGLRSVASTMLRLAGLPGHELARRPALPLSVPGWGTTDGEPLYAEATLPATAYGWAPLRAVVSEGLKYIEAPRPELYDLAADPAEARDLAADRPTDAARLAELLDRRPGGAVGPAPEVDPATRAALVSLGYVDGTSANDGIDPKDGIELLAGLETATKQLRSGDTAAALRRLSALAARNPANAPLQTRLGEALLASGETEAGLAAYRRAAELQPRSEFARRNLGDAMAELGRLDDARAAYREAIDISPRWAPPWLRLADLAPDPGERAAILGRAAEVGVDSLTVYLRLAEAELDANPTASLATCRRIAELDPAAAEGALCEGRARLALGDRLRAGALLRRAAVLGRGTAVGDEAARQLEAMTAADGR